MRPVLVQFCEKGTVWGVVSASATGAAIIAMLPHTDIQPRVLAACIFNVSSRNQDFSTFASGEHACLIRRRGRDARCRRREAIAAASDESNSVKDNRASTCGRARKSMICRGLANRGNAGKQPDSRGAT